MADRFTTALLAALNDSVELQESDWDSLVEVLRASREVADARPKTVEPADPVNRFAASENRLAETVFSSMAKVRAGQ
jgi:hypothetical protein